MPLFCSLLNPCAPGLPVIMLKAQISSTRIRGKSVVPIVSYFSSDISIKYAQHLAYVHLPGLPDSDSDKLLYAVETAVAIRHTGKIKEDAFRLNEGHFKFWASQNSSIMQQLRARFHPPEQRCLAYSHSPGIDLIHQISAPAGQRRVAKAWKFMR